jgi:hypothetical protein
MTLYWMGDAPETGRKQHTAYVRAESPEDALAEARLLGINPCEDYCVDVSNHVPENFIGRLLSRADLDELGRLADANDS